MAVAIDTAATPANPQPPNATPNNKKPRKNPARRKADRAASNTNLNQPKETTTSSKGSTVVPSPLARQTSAPSVVNRPTIQGRKSSIASSTPTAPPTSTVAISQTPNNSTATRAKQQPKPSTPITTPPRPSLRRSHTTSSSLSFNAPALVTGGLIGCAAGAAILMAVHVWYDFAGVKAAIATARAARICVDNLSEELITSLSVGTYSTDEALDILWRTTLAYASMIPDGAPVVERIFREIGLVRQSRGAEVDRVLAGAFEELRAAGDKGLSAVETRNVVLKHLVKLSLFASRATQDVLTRNPRLKPLRDGAVRALKEPPRDRVPTAKVNLVVKHK